MLVSVAGFRRWFSSRASARQAAASMRLPVSFPARDATMRGPRRVSNVEIENGEVPGDRRRRTASTRAPRPSLPATGDRSGRRCAADRPSPALRHRCGDQKNPSASAW
ncbi:hypothetical protein [Burkholderia sp. Ac-20344]|uniref:hypothetical protein n=1 Tax=Burkholderia sp. Ac-20344 TaxID=2703890 RepID=UPI00197C45F6|nr:hypothetical protein [Burkholderia sp. Ac-20344]MBN3837357.1 hypothetical protein [Burkholderia sp. Ac-20344]